jgi:hypothetical protein
MRNLFLHQIYYSEETFLNLDKGFLPLSNLKNERPDWFEYWPIKNYICNHELNFDDFYGFFSPNFKNKTQLNFDNLTNSLKLINLDNFDVISFSPFYDQISWYKNHFEQALFTCPDILPTLDFVSNIIFPNLSKSSYYSTSLDTIYSNYFIANGKFWHEWFNVCEKIFDIAENYSDINNNLFTNNTKYKGNNQHIKIFIIERIASLLIKNNNFRSSCIQNEFSSYAIPEFIYLKDDLIILDSLKIAYNMTGKLSYINEFLRYRLETLNKLTILRNSKIA